MVGARQGQKKNLLDFLALKKVNFADALETKGVVFVLQPCKNNESSHILVKMDNIGQHICYCSH